MSQKDKKTDLRAKKETINKKKENKKVECQNVRERGGTHIRNCDKDLDRNIIELHHIIPLFNSSRELSPSLLPHVQMNCSIALRIVQKEHKCPKSFWGFDGSLFMEDQSDKL